MYNINSMQLDVLWFLNHMAHFAEIKQKTDPSGFTSKTLWIVERVVVVDNSVVPSDKHPAGEEWCKKFFNGGEWKQCSYNNNFRGKFPGKSDVYDKEKDVFYKLQPYASWTLSEHNQWVAPVYQPEPHQYSYTDSEGVNRTSSLSLNWDEENQRWFGIHQHNPEDPMITFHWDPNTSQWIQQ
jgi:hypothetical protein